MQERERIHFLLFWRPGCLLPFSFYCVYSVIGWKCLYSFHGSRCNSAENSDFRPMWLHGLAEISVSVWAVQPLATLCLLKNVLRRQRLFFGAVKALLNLLGQHLIFCSGETGVGSGSNFSMRWQLLAGVLGTTSRAHVLKSSLILKKERNWKA